MFDLIIFGVIEWNFLFQRPQQLACQFAGNGHRVFYVGPSFADPAEEGKTAPMITRVRSNVYAVHLPGPSSFSVYRDRLEGKALELCTAVFQTLQQEQDIIDAISFVQLPFWRPLAERLRNEFGWKVVYDCLDRHSGFSTNGPAMLAEEATLVRTSDLVVTTARVLYEECSASNPRCVLVPNATDFDHFGVFVGPTPLWLEHLQRPVIGYHGAIAEWFDTALVGQMARMRPQWSFVLVGGTFTADLRPLEGLSNVHLTGEQPYKMLPAYLHSFDACLIPFRQLPLTEATNPVKFYEYLSAGKPVVSVPLPELQPFEADGLIYLADDASTFITQIERAIAENSVDRVSSRMRFAKRETWTERYHVLADEICRLFPRVSIIIPTYNNLHLSRLCVDSILRNTTWPNYELVIVDNASTDETPAYLRTLSERDARIRCILNARNEGFARANNQGIAAATGDYLALLNNDTIVPRGWLTKMVGYLETHPDVGMIGPATNETGNEEKINVDYASIGEMEVFAERYMREHANQALELNMLSFFCVVIPRRVLDKIGLLDEKFGVGMFEDDDLCLRARRAGYKLICLDGAFVHHVHNATWKRFSEAEYLRIFQENQKKFEQKWNIQWTPHRFRWER